VAESILRLLIEDRWVLRGYVRPKAGSRPFGGERFAEDAKASALMNDALDELPPKAPHEIVCGFPPHRRGTMCEYRNARGGAGFALPAIPRFH
jgi:hypothetical protein